VWLRVVHQLFFLFVSEPDEHVLTGTLQAFSVVLDKSDETVDVIIFFEVNGQYVTQWPFLLVALRLAEWKRSVLKVKRIATYNQSPQYYRVTLSLIGSRTLSKPFPVFWDLAIQPEGGNQHGLVYRFSQQRLWALKRVLSLSELAEAGGTRDSRCFT